jgi:hypothetical protein
MVTDRSAGMERKNFSRQRQKNRELQEYNCQQLNGNQNYFWKSRMHYRSLFQSM